MPIFQIEGTRLSSVAPTTFGAQGMYERRDIQALLRDNIEVLGERLLVISEEFGDWIDSSRRIDLLCLDESANLVVVELKRTEDGGHMELQALRYAAMVSAMKFNQAVETFARRLNRAAPDLDAAADQILEFLGWDELSEEKFATETRIILASADFSKELTTSVMWLNDFGIDIRCVRLKPYKLENGPILLDIQQLIPLPEAASFQTQIGAKRQAERTERAERHDLRQQWWAALIGRSDAGMHRRVTPGPSNWISVSSRGLGWNYVVTEHDARAELYIDRGKGSEAENKAIFDGLEKHRDEIEQKFGAPIQWLRMDHRRASLVRAGVSGGYRSPEDEWSAIQGSLIDAMNRLHTAIQPYLAR